MKSDRTADNLALLAGLAPVMGLACLILLWVGMAVFCAEPDATWADVRKEAAALNKLKSDQWHAKVDEACRLLPELRAPEGRIRATPAALDRMSDREADRMLEGLRLEVEWKRSHDAFNNSGDYDAKVRRNHEAVAKLREFNQAVYGEHIAQARQLKQQSLMHLLRTKPGEGLLVGLGIVAALLMTQPIELRHLRVIQVIVIPSLLFSFRYSLIPAYDTTPSAGEALADFISFLIPAALLAIILGPNIAYYVAHMIQATIDPQNWTPTTLEDTALGTVRRLIHEDNYEAALAELDSRLAKSKPTYEALLLKAKLLFHLRKLEPARKTLLELLPLSLTAEQQKVAMQGLREVR